MTPLTLQELNEYANTTINNSVGLLRAYNTFSICKLVGCRAGELDISKWENFANSTTVLQTLKKNNPRVFLTDELPNDFVVAISSQNKSYFLNSYSTIKMYFDRFSPYQLYKGNKP